ncbi:MAG: hypothetical protein QME96_12825, partial [Myxococcota bacterium]|nr:hypothetical protein [Myxococcota bacterium]
PHRRPGPKLCHQLLRSYNSPLHLRGRVARQPFDSRQEPLCGARRASLWVVRLFFRDRGHRRVMRAAMNEVEARIDDLAGPIAAAYGCEPILTTVRRGNRATMVTVYLDVVSPEPDVPDRARAERPFDPVAEPAPEPYLGSPVSVGTCARVSAELGAAIDAEDAVVGRYVLEVSSPGIERPLVRPKDFVRFRGHPVDVRFREAGGGTAAGVRGAVRREAPDSPPVQRVRGILSSVGADAFDVVPEPPGPAGARDPGGSVRVPFDGVVFARLVYRRPVSGGRGPARGGRPRPVRGGGRGKDFRGGPGGGEARSGGLPPGTGE